MEKTPENLAKAWDDIAATVAREIMTTEDCMRTRAMLELTQEETAEFELGLNKLFVDFLAVRPGDDPEGDGPGGLASLARHRRLYGVAFAISMKISSLAALGLHSTIIASACADVGLKYKTGELPMKSDGDIVGDDKTNAQTMASFGFKSKPG